MKKVKATDFPQPSSVHNWKDHSGSLSHQQRYLEKLQKHKTDILTYDHEYQKEFGRRVANLEKSRRGDHYWNSSDSRLTSRLVKNQPYFQIEMSQTPRQSYGHLKFPRDPCYYAVNKRQPRTVKLQPISTKRKFRESNYSNELLKSQLQRLDSHPIHPSITETTHVLPDITYTPRNTPISPDNRDYTTLHRLSIRLSRDPQKSQIKDHSSPKISSLQREKTDFEPFESIIERNNLNIEDYYKGSVDIFDSDDVITEQSVCNETPSSNNN